ncbi:MAG TPA: DsbA family protein [Candidatus Paceibacterota bacterium]
MSTETKSSVAIPAAIVVAGLIIAAAVFFTRGAAPAGTTAAKPAAAGDPKAVAAVTAADHIRGSLDAPVKVVEYSDIDCPFCQRVHPTLKQLQAEYGDKVAWVYRHNPITGLHPNAETKAIATECVAKLAGNDAFWKFLDAVTEDTAPGRNDLTRLPALAAEAGVTDAAAFKECLDSKEGLSKIKADMANAAATGGRGTPWTIVVSKDGKEAVAVSGAQPIDAFKAAVDSILK